MKNLLLTIACIPLIIIACGIYFAGITSCIWLPLVLHHWSGVLIGLFIAAMAEVLTNLFSGD